MEHYPLSHSRPSSRPVVYAANGMVCTGQPLAAQAGLRVLMRGGNAVDAAVATAAALTVVEPTANGIGGDAFALVWKDGRLYGLNASGPAPAALSLDTLRALHAARARRTSTAPVTQDPPAIDPHGWESVTVPGAPAGWAALSERFGALPFADLLEDAIRYASDGFPVSPVCARYWARAAERYRAAAAGLLEEWFRVFTFPGSLPDSFVSAGRAPEAGEIWRSPDHATTLEEIARTRAASFYSGAIAERIDRFSRSTGGFLRRSDLAAFSPEWVDSISMPYRGYNVWELPPNGQGMVALSALGILSGDDMASLSPEEAAHLQIEALKLAFADASAYLAEPGAMPVDPTALIDPAYLAGRRRLIGPEAGIPTAGRPERGGTVYLATADSKGMMVSYIQSNYMGFGSGIVVPGTGIALHNRGCNFSTVPGHPNHLEPGKQPYHTIIPGFLTRGGRGVGPFGVMGGFMQPQGHLQVLFRLIDQGRNPQEALDAPRFCWLERKRVLVEPDFDSGVLAGLRERGHELEISGEPAHFGRGQIILRDEDGVLCGGTEKRTDGCAAAY